MGTLLASIGVPLLLNALTGNDDFMLIDIVQRDLYPFMCSYGTWDGMGVKKGTRAAIRQKTVRSTEFQYSDKFYK